MRPYTKYLDLLTKEQFNGDFHLGGSTPPLPPKLLNKSVSVKLNFSNYKKQLTDFKKHIAKKASTTEAEISLMPGSGQAAFQVLAALTEPGDTVIIEYPAYEPYLAAARFLGLNVVRFQRTGDIQADLAEIKNIAWGAKLILLSNPHCPTGWMYAPKSIQVLSEIKPWVVVDEVFLSLFSANAQFSHRSLLAQSNKFVFIGGLSKTTGLGFARTGWTIAAPEVADRITKIGGLLHCEFPAPSIPIAELALKNWKVIHSQICRLASQNRKLLNSFRKNPAHYLSHDLARGFFAMLKVPNSFSSGKAFTTTLLEEGVLVRDGAHFEMPEFVRFHTLLPSKQFKAAFAKIEKFYA